MFRKNRSGTWYGIIQSGKDGSMIVIWNPVLPKANTGKVFLYNTEKQKLIKYVEEIVQPKLKELTGEELEAARSSYDEGWRKVRGLYDSVEDEPEKEAEKPATRIDSELDAELMNIDDDDLEIE